MPISLKFKYKNHRDEIADRHISFHGLDYITNPGFNYEPGWFITGYDFDKLQVRSFAVVNIIPPETHPGSVYRIAPIDK